MSKHNRERRERNRANNVPGPRHESLAQRARRLMNEMPTAVDYVELPDLGFAPGADPAATSGPLDAEPENAATDPGSRANAVKASLRAKTLFPLEMLNSIMDRTREFSIKVRPDGALESYLVRELARSSVIDEKVSDQLQINDLREVEKVGGAWDIERSVNAATLGSTLGESPQVVSETLAATKHGALYLIKQWSYLEDSVKTNGGLSEEQRQVAYDLLGVDHIYRDGCSQVPKGTDTQGLSALVARELFRHRRQLERVLNDCDASERGMAMIGIVDRRDNASKLLLASQGRARRRFSWAWRLLKELRAGADPSTLIDDETGKPVVPGPPLVAVRPRTRPAAAPAAPSPTPTPPTPPPSSPPPAPAASAEPSIARLLAGLPAEAKEMFLVAAAAVLNAKTASVADEPEPPPTA